MAARRHGSQNGKLNAHMLKHKLNAMRMDWKQNKAFVSQPSSSSVILKFSKKRHQLGTAGVQISEVMGDILFQTTTKRVKMYNFYCGVIDFFFK